MTTACYESHLPGKHITVSDIVFASSHTSLTLFGNDIMVDTAGYGGRTVSPLSGLNRTNDNILLYNPLHCTARMCWCPVKASPKLYKKHHCIWTTVRLAHFLLKIFSVICWVRQWYFHCKKYRLISAVSTKNRCSAYVHLISKTAYISFFFNCLKQFWLVLAKWIVL